MGNLSKDDVDRLLNDPSAESRADAARKVAGVYGASLSEAERRLAEDIFRIMTRDAETLVRAALSQTLKDNPTVPHDVAVALARDVEDVSAPMLRHSDVLTDDDLLDILRHRPREVGEAVAARKQVSPRVSEAIIDTGFARAVARLMGNQNADIAEEGLEKALARFGDDEAVTTHMVRRPHLPLRVAERLVSVVSGRLRDHLVTHHNLSADVASDLVLQGRERATMTLLTPGSDSMEVNDLVDSLFLNGRLTPTILFRALALGDMVFFESGLARLVGIPVANAQTLIHDPGRLGLRSLLEKASIPPRLSEAIEVAVEVAEETDYDGRPGDRERYRRRMIERFLTKFETVDAENFEYLMARLAKPSGA